MKQKISLVLVLATLSLNPLAIAQECDQFSDPAQCTAAGCAWYDLSHVPFGGGEKGCYSPGRDSFKLDTLTFCKSDADCPADSHCNLIEDPYNGVPAGSCSPLQF